MIGGDYICWCFQGLKKELIHSQTEITEAYMDERAKKQGELGFWSVFDEFCLKSNSRGWITNFINQIPKDHIVETRWQEKVYELTTIQHHVG